MSAVCLEPGLRRNAKPQPAPRRLRLRALWPAVKLILFTLIAGLLIMAHGCHGDEDNELFTGVVLIGK